MKTIERLHELVTAGETCEPQEPPSTRRDLFALRPATLEARKVPFLATQAELQSPAFFGQFIGLRQLLLSEDSDGRSISVEFEGALSASLAFMVASLGLVTVTS